MKYTIIIMTSVLLRAPSAFAATSALPKDFVLVDVLGKEKIPVEWALPAGHGQGCLLAVDPSGNPWLGCKGHFLEGAAYAALDRTSVPFDALAWMANGTLMGLSGDQIGQFSLAAAGKSAHVVAESAFRKLGGFPGNKVSMFGGAGDNLYIVVANDAGSEVLLLRPRKVGGALSKLFHTKEHVTAVGGDGDRTFVAVGRRVIGLERAGTDEKPELNAEILFEHPSSEVTALAYSPKLGLFYGSTNGAGYLGSRYRLQFIKAAGAQIQLSGDSLYVQPSSGGILKLSGLERFADMDAELTARGVPINPELQTGPLGKKQ